MNPGVFPWTPSYIHHQLWGLNLIPLDMTESGMIPVNIVKTKQKPDHPLCADHCRETCGYWIRVLVFISIIGKKTTRFWNIKQTELPATGNFTVLRAGYGRTILDNADMIKYLFTFLWPTLKYHTARSNLLDITIIFQIIDINIYLEPLYNTRS